MGSEGANPGLEDPDEPTGVEVVDQQESFPDPQSPTEAEVVEEQSAAPEGEAERQEERKSDQSLNDVGDEIRNDEDRGDMRDCPTEEAMVERARRDYGIKTSPPSTPS